MSPPTSSSSEELSFRLQPDGRYVLSRKRARELLAPLSKARYTSISLGGCAIGDAAAGVAGPALVALANMQCVRTVVFSDCIASLTYEEAIRSLNVLSSSIGMWKGLRSVDLSYNALGSIGIAQCAPLLRGQRGLEELRLVEAGLGAESVRLIEDYVCQGPTTRLKLLHVHANRVESAGFVYFSEIVERSPEIQSLRLSSLGARPEALKRLASALKGKVNLRDLDLSDNLLDVPAAQELGDVLAMLPKLERLVLRDLGIRDDALRALLDPFLATDAQPPLAELVLAGNELSPDAAQSIGTTLSTYGELLQVVDLSRNELGTAGAESITEALAEMLTNGERVVLSQLLLADNEMPSLPIVRLALQLVTIPDFQCLDITGNFVSERVFDNLATALGSNAVLFHLGESEFEGEAAEAEPDQEDAELEEALQELANVPSKQQKVTVAEVPVINEQSSSTQSTSTVSRLRSLFSRGSDAESQQASSSRPASNVQNVTVSTPIAPPGSFEDDSGGLGYSPGQQGLSPEPKTPTGRGTTVTSTTTQEGMSPTDTAYSPYTPVGGMNTANANVIKSARKLKESIASLSKEISDVAGELQVPVSSSPLPSNGVSFSGRGGEIVGSVSDYLLVDDLPQGSMRKQSALGVLVDILGGLLVGAFVVILVLAIAQSQDESSFAYRLV